MYIINANASPTVSLVTSRTVEEVLQVLKKEISKTYEETETSDAYRRQLVKALHTCAVRFPEKAVAIVPILMEFIGDSNAASAGVCVCLLVEMYVGLGGELTDLSHACLMVPWLACGTKYVASRFFWGMNTLGAVYLMVQGQKDLVNEHSECKLTIEDEQPAFQFIRVGGSSLKMLTRLFWITRNGVQYAVRTELRMQTVVNAVSQNSELISSHVSNRGSR